MNKIRLLPEQAKHKISRHLYGQFAEHLAKCIYDGIWVGKDSAIPNTRGIRNDMIEALKKIKVPNVRWPGGNFVKTYNWKDAIGPVEKRPERPSEDHRETNHFGTHEFLDFCELIGCEPYICANVTGGTPQLMQDWMEYITYDGCSPITDLRKRHGREKPWKCSLWAIGNETWDMSPEHYADVYKRFAVSAVSWGEEPTVRVACGPAWAKYEWTEALMKNAHEYMEGLALHAYTIPREWKEKGPSVEFTEEDWFKTLIKSVEIEEMIDKHSAIMDRYDPDMRVALVVDEWGTWYEPLPGYTKMSHYQANTVRDAVVAGFMLNTFNNHCDRLRMANIAQLVNVLQCMAHIDGERMHLTPTYHVFDIFKVHQDATLIPIRLESELYWYENRAVKAISCSASKNKDGRTNITFANLNPNKTIDVVCAVADGVQQDGKGAIVAGGDMNDHNTFDEPERITAQPFTDFKIENDELRVSLPSASVVLISLY